MFRTHCYELSFEMFPAFKPLTASLRARAVHCETGELDQWIEWKYNFDANWVSMWKKFDIQRLLCLGTTRKWILNRSWRAVILNMSLKIRMYPDLRMHIPQSLAPFVCVCLGFCFADLAPSVGAGRTQATNKWGNKLRVTVAHTQIFKFRYRYMIVMCIISSYCFIMKTISCHQSWLVQWLALSHESRLATRHSLSVTRDLACLAIR